MKKTIISAAAVLLAMVACNKTEPSLSLQEGKPQETRESLTINLLDGAQTKATSAMTENTIANVTVFVFNADGSYDNSAYSSGSSVTVNVRRAPGKKIYAIANAGDLSSTNTESSVKALTSTLGVNADGRFVMAGSDLNADLSSKTTFSVEVSRIAAKIVLQGIENAMPSSLGSFTVNRIFIANAVTGTPAYFSSFTPTASSPWANKCGKYTADAALDKFLAEASSIVVANGGKNSTAHYFYVYPNPTETDSVSPTWSVRQTRLMIIGTVNGVQYAYPITIDSGIKSNHQYTITSAKILGVGNDPGVNPEDPIVRGGLSFSVTSSAWVPVDLGTVEL